jgi:hypothetical protein
MKSRVMPNLFLVGAAKAGTSSLYEVLRRHPDVFMSSHKEPHYFADLDVDHTSSRLFNVVQDRHSYLSLFDDARSHLIIGEASTSYLTDIRAPERIQAAAPTAKVIAILRDPVERAYSHYLNDVRKGLERRSFLRAVEDALARPAEQRWPAHYVRYGEYGSAIQRYYSTFGRNQVLVLFFEQMIAHQAETLRTLTDFLGIEPFASELLHLERANGYARPRWIARSLMRHPKARLAARRVIPAQLRPRVHMLLSTEGMKPPIPPRAATLLRQSYAGDIAELEKILMITPPWPTNGTASQQ